ncbi:hypothetical protein Pelo_4119 [Pelomyxa schiedti]|nr:hypothetical protein Pelo_4119 [Pelomyxa schiedti]
MRLHSCLCILVSLSVLLQVVAGSPYYNRDGDSGAKSIAAAQRATNNNLRGTYDCSEDAVNLCLAQYDDCISSLYLGCLCVNSYGDCLKNAECSNKSADCWQTYYTYCQHYGCDCDDSTWNTELILLFSILLTTICFVAVWFIVVYFVRRRMVQHRTHETERLLTYSGYYTASHSPEPPLLVPEIPDNSQELESTKKGGENEKENAEGSVTSEATDAEPGSSGPPSTASKEPTPTSDLQGLCKICMVNKLDTVFVPCGHRLCCVECSQRLHTCALCRKEITLVVKTYDV